MAGKLLDSPRARRKGTDQALVGHESNNQLLSPSSPTTSWTRVQDDVDVNTSDTEDAPPATVHAKRWASGPATDRSDPGDDINM